MAEMLSAHFSVDEFEYSDTARARNIPNKMTTEQKAIAKHTAQYLLENVRSQLNKWYASSAVKCVTIRITSGFRGPQLNKAVGGASNSQHCQAMACDIEATVVYKDGRRKVIPYNELYEVIKHLVRQKRLYIDQCIQESSNGAYWVHISLPKQISQCRYQFLKYQNGKYTLDCVLK